MRFPSGSKANFRGRGEVTTADLTVKGWDVDIKGANTEAYCRFLRAHEDLGSNIKLAYGALHAISQDEKPITSGRSPNLVFLPTGGEPWGKNTRWRSVKARVPNVRELISEMGLVLAASAFEDFLTNVHSEHTRFSDFTRNQKSPELANGKVNEDRERLHLLFSSLQWAIAPIEYLLPLYDYFVVARNCVVHRSGRASPALVEKAESSTLAECVKKWPSRRGKSIPQLPQVQVGRDISLLPRHVILFSEVCQRVALYINSKMLGFLGVQGLVYLAAHDGLLSDRPIHTVARRSPEQVINFILTDRCQVELADKYEVIGILKKMNVWTECRTNYKKLFGNTG